MIALLVALLVQQTDAAPPAKKLGASGAWAQAGSARQSTSREGAGTLQGPRIQTTLWRGT